MNAICDERDVNTFCMSSKRVHNNRVLKRVANRVLNCVAKLVLKLVMKFRKACQACQASLARLSLGKPVDENHMKA